MPSAEPSCDLIDPDGRRHKSEVHEHEAHHQASTRFLETLSGDRWQRVRLKDFDPGETLDLASEDKPQMLSALTGRNIARVWERVARSPHSNANSLVSGCVRSIDENPCLR